MFSDNSKRDGTIYRYTVNASSVFYGTPEKSFVNTIGDRIRHFAKTRFGTLKRFGEAVGLTPSRVTEYVQNQYIPGGDILVRFKEVGMSLDWLVSGEGEMLAEDQEKGRIVYPSEVGPSAKIVGEVKVGDVVYGLVEIEPINKKKGKDGKDEREGNQSTMK